MRAFTREIGLTAGKALGSAIDRAVSAHHARRLRKIGWKHALEGDATLEWARGGMRSTTGNKVEVLIDGASFLPSLAEELARAESHVHLTGWNFSPELELTRGEAPAVLRTCSPSSQDRIDVRVLIWSGAPLPLFRPARRDVREVVDRLCRRNRIQCELDSCVRFMHCHHEKTIVVDDRVAFVGGIDLTLDAGDPYDTQEHPARGGVGWHDVAVRIEVPPSQTSPSTSACAGTVQPTRSFRPRRFPAQRATSTSRSFARSRRTSTRSLPRGDFSVLESYVNAIQSAQRLIYIENQFLWSSEIVALIAEKLRDPPHDHFRVVLLLPVSANDGADVSRGQVAALIQADDRNARFLACSVYARTGKLRDPIYVHSKVAIVDDRWLTVGSANLNEHSLFNDSEVNVVVHDEALARDTRLRLWSEHLELPSRRSTRTPRQSSTSGGSRSQRNSSSAWRTTSR